MREEEEEKTRGMQKGDPEKKKKIRGPRKKRERPTAVLVMSTLAALTPKYTGAPASLRFQSLGLVAFMTNGPDPCMLGTGFLLDMGYLFFFSSPSFLTFPKSLFFSDVESSWFTR